MTMRQLAQYKSHKLRTQGNTNGAWIIELYLSQFGYHEGKHHSLYLVKSKELKFYYLHLAPISDSTRNINHSGLRAPGERNSAKRADGDVHETQGVLVRV